MNTTDTTTVETPSQDDSNHPCGGDEKFYMEEFKIFTSAIFDIDKRVAQVFGFTMAAAVSLSTWTAKIILEPEQSVPLALVYASLMPNLLLLPAYFYLIAQRRDLIGFAAYVRLLETRLGVSGFQTGLHPGEGSLRTNKNRGGESNDPIPYAFWALFLITALIFLYGIQKSGGSLCQLTILLIPIGLLSYCHWAWKRIIPDVLPELIEMWADFDKKRKTPKSMGSEY